MALRILQIGTTGQLARALTARAPAFKAEMTALSRTDLDLTDPEAIKSVIAGAEPFDICINAAAYTAVDKAEDEQELASAINAVAPGLIAEACAARWAGMIHLSTDYVFDGTKDGPYEESDEPNPQNVYGLTKLAGEAAVAAALRDHVILRTSWVFDGEGQNFFTTMLRLAESEKELQVVNDQIGAPTAAVHLADAVLTAAAALAGKTNDTGVFHCTGGGQTSWAGFAEAILADALPKDATRPTLTPIPSAAFPTRAKRPLNSRLSNARFAEAFETPPPDWREGLKAVIAARLPVNVPVEAGE